MKRLLVVLAAVAAVQSVPAAALEQGVIARAKLAFSAQLNLTRANTGTSEWIARDAVYQYFLDGSNVRLRIAGRRAVTEYLQSRSDLPVKTSEENIHYYPTLDPQVVFVQYERVSPGGRGERRNTIAIIEMRGDQIVGFTQLGRPGAYLEALEATAERMN